MTTFLLISSAVIVLFFLVAVLGLIWWVKTWRDSE